MKVNLATLARCRVFLLSLVLLLVCLAGHAQQNSTITGTVLDKAGALIPGAEVTLTQQQTGFVTKADQQRQRQLHIQRIERWNLRSEGHCKRL